MATALINGRAYDFSQIEINLLNGKLYSATSIDYSTEQEKSNNPGQGVEPVSRGRGSKDYSGSVELSMTDIEAIREGIDSKELVDLDPFDITVTFLHPESNRVKSDVLKNCEFTNEGVSGSTGDTDLKFTLNLVIGKIKYG